MAEFSRYYMNFLSHFFKNIKDFFSNIFLIIKNFVYTDPKEYLDLISGAAVKFKVLDWIVFLIVTIINVAFFALLAFLLGIYLKRHLRFKKREIEKDELVEEISLLNNKVVELIDEKNKILAMRVSQLGGGQAIVKPEDMFSRDKSVEKKPQNQAGGRFTKLSNVDQIYSANPRMTLMPESDMLNLKQLVDRFIDFSASQLNLYYTRDIISRYFAGMATAKVLILEGISGTGKTSLPYAMGKFFQSDSSIISVQPSWRDRAELLGYLNEFTKKFNETDFLKSVYEANYIDTVNTIVLDEMNLARIEYYFAEFLSVMEMPDTSEWKIDLVSGSEPTDPKKLINGKLLINQNVWFIGTANKDDSTFTITDKVYDRALPIVINNKAAYIDAPYTPAISMTFEYLDELFKQAQQNVQITPKTMDSFSKVDDFIQDNFKIAFGNRIMKQIKLFVPVYMTCGYSEIEGLDYMLCNKILRKFESLNITFLKTEIDQLIQLLDKLFGKNSFKTSIDFLNDLKKMN